MQRLEVSAAVRHICGSLGVKGLITNYYSVESNKYSKLWYKVCIFQVKGHISATYLYTSYDQAFFPQPSFKLRLHNKCVLWFLLQLCKKAFSFRVEFSEMLQKTL